MVDRLSLHLPHRIRLDLFSSMEEDRLKVPLAIGIPEDEAVAEVVEEAEVTSAGTTTTRTEQQQRNPSWLSFASSAKLLMPSMTDAKPLTTPTSSAMNAARKGTLPGIARTRRMPRKTEESLS